MRGVAITGLALLLALFGSSAQADEPLCGMYPPPVAASGYGWSGCDMQLDGLHPLWHELPRGVARVTRFVFTQGHLQFYRAVSVAEHTDGTAELILSGTNRAKYGRRHKISDRKIRLSPEQVAHISLLGEQAGAWEFDFASWDGDGIYMHCEVLDMERADAAGYRYASVNIGCNKPVKLMPLIDEIVGLAGLKTSAGGMLYE